jgi:hypothetical protein
MWWMTCRAHYVVADVASTGALCQWWMTWRAHYVVDDADWVRRHRRESAEARRARQADVLEPRSEPASDEPECANDDAPLMRIHLLRQTS